MASEETTKNSLGGFIITETEGDIFDAPEDSILIHAVNCQGLWGSGIAKAFKSKYPAAFEVYSEHCKEESQLPGTCLLIPPQLEDYNMSSLETSEHGPKRKRLKVSRATRTKKHWVGCLFTSYSYGKSTKFKAGKDSPEKILSNTKAALKDLSEQLEALDVGRLDPRPGGLAEGRKKMNKPSGKVAERANTADVNPNQVERIRHANLGLLYACKFNSGSFGVDWEDTRALIKEVFDGSNRAMHVISTAQEI